MTLLFYRIFYKQKPVSVARWSHHGMHVQIQHAQLSQRDRAAGCVIVFAKSRRLELGDNILQTL